MRITAFIGLFLLCGCGVVHQAQLNSSAKLAESEIQNKCVFYRHLPSSEAQAWISAFEESEKCSSGISEPWPKDKTPEISHCLSGILNKKVKPISSSAAAYNIYAKDRLNSHKQYAAGEISWDELGAVATKRMETYFKAVNKGSYYGFTSCGNQVISQTVMPNYQFKPLLIDYMSKMSSFARSADKDKLAEEDFMIGAQKIWADFAMSEQQVMSQYQAQNAAAWQQTFQNLSTMQQIENQRLEAMRATTPPIRHTNCHVFNNNMNCTSF